MNLADTASPVSGVATAGMVRRPSVLMIEDDADLCMLVADYLRDEGYDVTSTGDGAEGMTMLREGNIDLVLLDLRLPGLDGFAFRAEQLADSRIRDVPVIVTTADDRPEARVIDADAVLRKPFDVQELTAKIREVLASREAEARDAQSRLSAAVALLANAMGHEIANPLMALIRGLECLREDQEGEGQREPGPDPKQLLDQCWRIVNSLRTLKGLPCPAWTRDSDVNLRDVVQSAMDQVRTEGTSIVLEGEEQAWVHGDPMVLLYLCTALLQNAVEAVPRAGKARPVAAGIDPEVEVRIGYAESMVVLDVRDSGAPILEEELARIFAPDNPGRERAWGAGLRLWFVRAIIETLGGAIEISNVANGVRSRVLLPARKRDTGRFRSS